MKDKQFDIFVIGGGSGGVRAARVASSRSAPFFRIRQKRRRRVHDPGGQMIDRNLETETYGQINRKS